MGPGVGMRAFDSPSLQPSSAETSSLSSVDAFSLDIEMEHHPSVQVGNIQQQQQQQLDFRPGVRQAGPSRESAPQDSPTFAQEMKEPSAVSPAGGFPVKNTPKVRSSPVQEDRERQPMDRSISHPTFPSPFCVEPQLAKYARLLDSPHVDLSKPGRSTLQS